MKKILQNKKKKILLENLNDEVILILHAKKNKNNNNNDTKNCIQQTYKREIEMRNEKKYFYTLKRKTKET